MSLRKYFVRDVTILHPVLVATGYGNSTEPDFTTPTPVLVRGWLDRVTESETETATRDANISAWVLLLPAGTEITSQDRVVVDGMTFEVDGEPARPWSPRGEHHVRCPLLLTDG